MPTQGGIGLDIAGVRYDTVKRTGSAYVEVSDEHAQLLKGSGLTVGEQWSAPTAPGITCSKCGFTQYKALAGDKCNRCGGDWE